MLLEFSFENYLSFKERTTISMVASSDKNLRQNLIVSVSGTKHEILKASVIYGANASGKSNFIRAATSMNWFIKNSVSRSKSDVHRIIRNCFKLDEKYKELPSSFEVIFLLDGIRYNYGFSLLDTFVCNEWLIYYPKGQSAVLFERSQDSQNHKLKMKFGTYWSGAGKSIVKLVQPSALFLTIASQMNNPIAKKIYYWFEKTFRSMMPFTFGEIETTYTADALNRNDEFKNKVMQFIKRADTNVENIKADEITIDKARGFSTLPPKLQDALFPESETQKVAKLVELTTVHKGVDADGNEISVEFNLDEESDGTQKFIALSGPWIYALENGCVLFADELDIRLHPLLSRWLVSLFLNEKTNPNNAQLIFTTHDSNLLDSNLLRRDQIWFTEKNNFNSSELYSLWDYKEKPKKGENIRKRYLEGRYGSIPYIDNS